MKKKHNKKNPSATKMNTVKSAESLDETSKNSSQKETETIGKKIYKYVMGLK